MCLCVRVRVCVCVCVCVCAREKGGKKEIERKGGKEIYIERDRQSKRECGIKREGFRKWRKDRNIET